MSEEKLQGEGDRFLIVEIRAGSADAFRRLVDRFSGRLRAFASRRLRGSGIDPDDAVQETFLSLLSSLEHLGEVRSLQAYLFTILRRRIADLARARGRAGEAVSLDRVDSGASFEPAAPAGTPSAHARRREALEASETILADVLDEYLSRLKSERRFRDLKVLEVVFAAERSQQEAARLAGTSEPTVSRVCRAAVSELGRLVSRHPQAEALEDLPRGHDFEHLVRRLWDRNLYSCLKRSTLGAYALGVLESDWRDYVRFHLEEMRCEFCAAHLEDVQGKGGSISAATRRRIFASSVGFLR